MTALQLDLFDCPDHQFFPSGASATRDLRGYAQAGRNVGVCLLDLSRPAQQQLLAEMSTGTRAYHPLACQYALAFKGIAVAKTVDRGPRRNQQDAHQAAHWSGFGCTEPHVGPKTEDAFDWGQHWSARAHDRIILLKTNASLRITTKMLTFLFNPKMVCPRFANRGHDG